MIVQAGGAAGGRGSVRYDPLAGGAAGGTAGGIGSDRYDV